MALNLEVWKMSVDLNYEVSSLGRVRSIPRFIRCGPGTGVRQIAGQVLVPFPSKKTQYYQVSLTDHKRHSVHRLVAAAFCDGFFNGAVVNHKNGDKKDNRSENLEWVTPSDNNKHAFRVLKRKSSGLGRMGGDHQSSKPISMISISTGAKEVFGSASEAVRKYPFLESGCVSRCCTGKIKSSKGYIFAFHNESIDPETGEIN